MFRFDPKDMPEEAGWEQPEEVEILPLTSPEPEIEAEEEVQKEYEIWLMDEDENKVIHRKPWVLGMEIRPPSPQYHRGHPYFCARKDEDANVWIYRKKWQA